MDLVDYCVFVLLWVVEKDWFFVFGYGFFFMCWCVVCVRCWMVGVRVWCVFIGFCCVRFSDVCLLGFCFGGWCCWVGWIFIVVVWNVFFGFCVGLGRLLLGWSWWGLWCVCWNIGCGCFRCCRFGIWGVFVMLGFFGGCGWVGWFWWWCCLVFGSCVDVIGIFLSWGIFFCLVRLLFCIVWSWSICFIVLILWLLGWYGWGSWGGWSVVGIRDWCLGCWWRSLVGSSCVRVVGWVWWSILLVFVCCCVRWNRCSFGWSWFCLGVLLLLGGWMFWKGRLFVDGGCVFWWLVIFRMVVVWCVGCWCEIVLCFVWFSLVLCCVRFFIGLVGFVWCRSWCWWCFCIFLVGFLCSVSYCLDVRWISWDVCVVRGGWGSIGWWSLVLVLCCVCVL